ncbi:hypothetical protein RYX36_003196, partial [Vicia faba]
DLGTCLNVPSKGYKVQCDGSVSTSSWEIFKHLDYYFSMCRISKEEFYAHRAQ